MVTGFVVYAATDNALCVAAAIAGAVIPDQVEGAPPKDNAAYWEWRRRHRTWSHYPLIYLALIVILLFARTYAQAVLDPSYMPTVELFVSVTIWAMIGALLHIIEDGLCGKVPIFTPYTKYGFKLFTVGSWQEYAFSAIIILICLASTVCDFSSLLDVLSPKLIKR